MNVCNGVIFSAGPKINQAVLLGSSHANHHHLHMPSVGHVLIVHHYVTHIMDLWSASLCTHNKRSELNQISRFFSCLHLTAKVSYTLTTIQRNCAIPNTPIDKSLKITLYLLYKKITLDE